MRRTGWLLLALASVSVGLLAPDSSRLVIDLRGPSFPDALLALGSLVQLALSCWVLLVVTLWGAQAPSSVLRLVAPRVLRRALFASAVGALAMAPVQADPVAAPGDGGGHDLAGLRLPDRPVAAPAHAAPRAAPAARVVVRAGDTLWAIAARSLPNSATEADIATACARWYTANRDVIGDDPDLIFPTQRLVPPRGKDPA
jgi:hypothetical protein